jgi:transcriptional regulator with XRE-family HTH domain
MPPESVSPENLPCHPYRRRQRQRKFLEALRQSTVASDVPAVDVGQRLRELRNERNLSIRALAERSQLNVNTISMIENGRISPSVATLQQLAFALDVSIADFFDAGAPKNKIVYQKVGQRSQIAFAYGTLADLGTGMDKRSAQSFLVVLEPHAESGPTPIVHTGREFVFCLEGRLAYIIEDQTFLLEPGDSLLFEAHLPHRWLNVGETPTRSLLVLCPSDEHDRPEEQHFMPKSAHNVVK